MISDQILLVDDQQHAVIIVNRNQFYEATKKRVMNTRPDSNNWEHQL